MTKLPENACVYPFKAAMLAHGLPATPCCRFHQRFLKDIDTKELAMVLGGAEEGVATDLIEVMRSRIFDDLMEFNTETFREVRETMMRNEWHPGCYKCRADEETKGHSMRTEAGAFFEEFTDEVKLEYLEITVGRKCNLKCMSCGPEYSNKWDTDAIKFPELGVPAEEVEQLKKVEELDLTKTDDMPSSVFKDLKHIKVTGGEPFLHPQFLLFIKRLANEDLAPNITIEIFTNCTWWPAKTDYDSLAKFRKILICPSIDGTGRLNEVLRFPSKWSTVENTLDKWIAMRDELGWEKVEIKTATTINVINAPYMYDYLLWASVNKRINVMFQTVYEPNWLSITHWPDWYKQKLKYTVLTQFDNYPEYLPKVRCDRFDKLKRLLVNLCDTPSTEDKSKSHTDILKKLLRHRGILNLDDIARFKLLLDLDAKPIPEWGPGSRPDWQGRKFSEQK